jgi:hypothetical protein
VVVAAPRSEHAAEEAGGNANTDTGRIVGVWKAALRPYLTERTQNCGVCFATRHGLLECPFLWSVLVDALERGDASVDVLTVLRRVAVERVAPRYQEGNNVVNTWDDVVREGDWISQPGTVERRLSLVAQVAMPTAEGRGRGRGRGKARREYHAPQL